MNLIATNWIAMKGQLSTCRVLRVGLILGRTILALVILFALSQALEACPTCKDGMAQDPARMNLVRGYFWSILFMMSMPFVIFSCLGLYFYREMRRLKALNASVVPLPTTGLAESPSFSR